MEWLSKHDVSAIKLPSGSWEVSAVIGGYREHRVYFGYSREQAIAEFIKHFCSR